MSNSPEAAPCAEIDRQSQRLFNDSCLRADWFAAFNPGLEWSPALEDLCLLSAMPCSLNASAPA